MKLLLNIAAVKYVLGGGVPGFCDEACHVHGDESRARKDSDHVDTKASRGRHHGLRQEEEESHSTGVNGHLFTARTQIPMHTSKDFSRHLGTQPIPF